MRRVLVVVAVAVFLGGCEQAATMKAYPGSDQSDAQVAILDDSNCGWKGYNVLGDLIQDSCIYSIKKGDHVYYDITRDPFALTFRLQPGEYLITHGIQWRISGPQARVGPPVGAETQLDLRAGHTYSTGKYFCAAGWWYGCSRVWYYWIQDDTTGNVLDGTKPTGEVPGPKPAGEVPGPMPTGRVYCPPNARAEFTRCL
jgi:hypothetical protein